MTDVTTGTTSTAVNENNASGSYAITLNKAGTDTVNLNNSSSASLFQDVTEMAKRSHPKSALWPKAGVSRHALRSPLPCARDMRIEHAMPAAFIRPSVSKGRK